MASAQSPFFEQFAHSAKNLRRLRAAVWLITISAGFIQAWASRFSISPDGNSYLDIASAYLAGDWSHAINAFWSPLFSWLLALCFGIFRPGAYWDSTVIHLLNFVGLLLSLWAFEFFFRTFLRWQRQRYVTQEAEEPLPEFGWWALGYALFLSTSLLVLTLVNSTPDVFVAVFTYLAAGLLLRIAINGGSWRLFVAIGFTLGVAYLTKSLYFPMGFVFLLVAWLAAGDLRKTIKQAAVGFLAFILVAGPWIGVQSRAKNRLTFGDAGKLNFAIFYDRIPRFLFWQGDSESGIPAHPVRQLLVKPHLYEFGTPIGGSYPPVFDPSYWMEGVRTRFRWHSLLLVLRQSAGTFFQIWALQVEFAVASLILFFFLPSRAEWLLVLRSEFYLWLPPLIACFSYCVVLVEFRYVAPFVLLLWVAAFASMLGLKSQLTRRLALSVVFAALTVTSIRLVKSTVSDVAVILAGPGNIDWRVAEGLWSLGAQPGDKVAGLANIGEVHWSRLAGVKIVAEIPSGDENAFWTAKPHEKQEVLRAFASTGAKFVVAKNPPTCAQANGWVQLGDTEFYAYKLLSKDQFGQE